MQCLDYIMRVQHKNNTEDTNYVIDHNTVDVEKFFVDHKLVTQLSDHYALKAVLVPSSVYRAKNGGKELTDGPADLTM